ncbi:MAG TPA: hypothetical protein VFQ43_15825, partial [Nitrososphaera sp.]|nr:hypothetical protein [Nitrososphaera sp.]
LCPSSRVRSLRPDRRISPDERDRATGEPRTVVYPGIESTGCARPAVALLIPCADIPEIVDGLVTGRPVKRLVVPADQLRNQHGGEAERKISIL